MSEVQAYVPLRQHSIAPAHDRPFVAHTAHIGANVPLAKRKWYWAGRVGFIRKGLLASGYTERQAAVELAAFEIEVRREVAKLRAAKAAVDEPDA